jgi:rod shape-determining protein MreC
MADMMFISRHRPLALLAAAVLAQVMVLAYQIKREHDVRLLRYWAAEVVTPTGRAGTWGFSKVAGVWKGYFALHHARVENEQLKAELGELQLRNRELESQAAEGQRLAGLLSFHDAHPETSMLAAQVIDASADPASRTMFINRGERDHIRRNMGVITPEGIVGKIVETYPTKSEVLLISDKDSGVGALLADTRTHGVVKGGGDSGPHLDYVVNDEKVHAGEVVVTSGEDRIFPKDLLVGKVVDFHPGNPFQVIRVSPAVRLDRLEDVLVLLTQQEMAPKKTDDASASPTATDDIVQSETTPTGHPIALPAGTSPVAPAADASKPATTPGGPGAPSVSINANGAKPVPTKPVPSKPAGAGQQKPSQEPAGSTPHQ